MPTVAALRGYAKAVKKTRGDNYARTLVIGLCTGFTLLLLFVLIGTVNSPGIDGTRSSTQRHPPSLYVIDYGSSPEKRWYVVSAFIDTRPLAFQQPGAITLVAAGPHEDVRNGKSWVAVIFMLSENGSDTKREVARLPCASTQYINHDSHATSTPRTVAPIICSDKSAWDALKRITHSKLGVCLMNDASSADGCGAQHAIVPINLPYNFPYFPTSWGQKFSYHPTKSSPGALRMAKTTQRAVAQMEASLRGHGDIAICISPVAGGLYTSTLRFFMQHYGQMGVSHIFMYMRRPSKAFEALAEDILDEQRKTHVQGDVPTLELVPWCLQQDATYGCVSGQPKLEPGFWNVSGVNFGQLLSLQDCFMRSIGRYKWTVLIDLDEYVVPHAPHIKNLHDLVTTSLLRQPSGRLLAPSELRFQSAFFEPCWPGKKDRALMSQNTKVAFAVRPAESYPRPIWAAARVSEVFAPTRRSKYMCDTLTCDRVGIHFGLTTMCDRFKGQSLWPAACTADPVYDVPIDQALLHHTRRRFEEGQVVHDCAKHPGNATDWSFANFAFGQRARNLGRSYAVSQTLA